MPKLTLLKRGLLTFCQNPETLQANQGLREYQQEKR